MVDMINKINADDTEEIHIIRSEFGVVVDCVSGIPVGCSIDNDDHCLIIDLGIDKDYFIIPNVDFKIESVNDEYHLVKGDVEYNIMF